MKKMSLVAKIMVMFVGILLFFTMKYVSKIDIKKQERVVLVMNDSYISFYSVNKSQQYQKGGYVDIYCNDSIYQDVEIIECIDTGIYIGEDTVYLFQTNCNTEIQGETANITTQYHSMYEYINESLKGN